MFSFEEIFIRISKGELRAQDYASLKVHRFCTV